MGNIKKFFLGFANFGIKILFFQAMTAITRKMNLPIQDKLRSIVRKNIKIYIKNNHYELFSKEYRNENTDTVDEKYPIWVFWEQGLKDAPDVVKICINSIKQNNPERRVNIITLNNLSDYVVLPNYIISKHKEGKIGYAHFSDIVRFALLYEYGGIWMDATLYQSGPMQFGAYQIKDFSLFTSKGSYSNLDCLFTSFFIACNKGNALAHWMRDFYYKYWEKEDMIIDYLLIDMALMVGYENISEIRYQIDLLPDIDTNENMYRLFYVYMNQKYDETIYSNLIKLIPVHKLSYKFPLRAKDTNGNITFYGMIYNKYNKFL